MIERSVAMQMAAARAASCPRSKRVFIEVYDAAVKIQCRGMSVAASVSSGSCKQHKRQKKPSKQERRAIVEAFVNKYRTSNGGRFPTVSHVQQQTGGGYYSVRQIIQELEYNHRMSSPDKHVGLQLGKVEKVSCPTSLAEPEEISSSFTTVSCTTDKQPLDFEADLNSKAVDSADTDEGPLVKHDQEIEHLEGKQLPLSADLENASVGEPLSPSMTITNLKSREYAESGGNSSVSSQTLIETGIKFIHGSDALPGLAIERMEDAQDSTEFQQANASTSTTIAAKKPSKPCEDEADSSVSPELEGKILCSHPQDVEDSAKDIECTESSKDTCGPEEVKQASNHEIPESPDQHSSEHPRVSEHKEPKGSNLWDNLKSLADGIIKFWKKI